MRRVLTDADFLTRVLVAGGLLLRAWHYLADHTIWYDEAVLLVNVMEKDFGQLLGPMHHAVAAPPLFVWLLKLLHLTAGDVTYVWRLVPFLFSVLGLLLTVPLARRVLPPPAAVLAVGLVAVSDNHIWLGCTVKPYAGDAAVATALLLYLQATAGRPAAKRLLVLAAVVPPLLCFSYTTVFVAGSLLLALVPAAWAGGTRGRLAWLLAAATTAGTLAGLHAGPMTAQRVDSLVAEWQPHFLPQSDPAAAAGWTVRAVLGVFQQACNPSGFVLGLLAPVGVWGLWWAGRREVATACVGVFALAILAAAVKAYPFGQHRLSQFLTPAAIVLGAAGVGELIRRWKWVGVTLAVLLVAVADGLSLSHLWEPWHRPDAQAVHRHVQAHRRPGDVVLSNEANYLYFFFGELRPIEAGGADVPAGGRAWVVMDHYDHRGRREYIDWRLRPLGFELVEDAEFFHAGVYLYERK